MSKKIYKKSIIATFTVYFALISIANYFISGYSQQLLIYFLFTIILVVLFYFLDFRKWLQKAKDNDLDVTLNIYGGLLKGLLCISIYFEIINLDYDFIKIYILILGIYYLIIHTYRIIKRA